MKKLFYFLTFFLSLLFINTGCEKEDEPTDPVVPVKHEPVYNAWASETTILLGDSVEIYWTSTYVDSVLISTSSIGKDETTISFGPNGSKYFVLDNTTEFLLIFIGEDGSTPRKNFTIDVTPIVVPPTTLYVNFQSYNVNYNDSVSFTVAGNFDSVTMNPLVSGFNGQSGTFWTDPILESTTFYFTAFGENGEIDLYTTITRNYFPLPWGAPLIKCERIVTAVLYSYTGEEPWTPFLSARLGVRYLYYNNMSVKRIAYNNVGIGNWDIKDEKFLCTDFEDPACHEVVVLTDSICKFKYQGTNFWVMYVMEPYLN